MGYWWLLYSPKLDNHQINIKQLQTSVSNLCLHFYTMPNPKGNPESLRPFESEREEPLSTTISFRATEKMKDEVKAQDDPAQFCREAIQEALDKKKKT